MEYRNNRKLYILLGSLVVLIITLIITVVVLVVNGKDTKESALVKEQNVEADVLTSLQIAVEHSETDEPTSETVEPQTEEPSLEAQDFWEPDSLRDGLTTAIEYEKQYLATIPSKEEAKKAIHDFGNMQRAKYSNPAVEAIELQLEEEYGIFAVNLGEMDEATALDIQRAVAYMFETYPNIIGTLTNISMGNFTGQDAGNIAITQNREFMRSGAVGECPYVVKFEIILNAAKFRNREKMLENCEYQVSISHWPKNTDISSIVVHELGHHLLDVIVMAQYGLEDAYYITEENEQAYVRYSEDVLADNQTTVKRIMEEAYLLWQEEYGHAGTKEEFRKSISEYALGIQADGGISYSETFAEAIADVYLNGEEAADASKSIISVVNKKIFS